MTANPNLTALSKGGSFIFPESTTNHFFTPEFADEEQKMIIDTIRSFIKQEIIPQTEAIENLEEGLMSGLVSKFGELGLLGTHMPEEYGGMDLDFITNTIIGQEVGPSGSFSVAYNAHTGIGMLPILYFGTEAQKQKYLPGLLSGELKASYCLTEPSSGSDALSAKTKADLTEDGKHYILNGQKMWITNAGFADVFTVFAQVEGHGFTAFLLEKGTDGFTLGAEEKKLGIKGSSTRQIFFENVKVPVENLLGELGKGHKIAFNVLNIGRYKLGASVVGGVKEILTESIRYANERIQFKVPISSFGAIKYKLAQQAIRTFVSESGLYRCADMIQNKINHLKEKGLSSIEAKLEAAEEFAIECSIIKVDTSEALDYCVDEAVQIFGGMGYSEEGVIARAYRDSRINRIFEGTNEINRLVIMSTLLKRAMNGAIDIATPAMAVQMEVNENKVDDFDREESYGKQRHTIKQYKKVLMVGLGIAAQQAMKGKLDLKEEQEVLMNVSDVMIAIYNLEATLARVEKLSQHEMKAPQGVYDAILDVAIHDAGFEIKQKTVDALSSFIREEKLPEIIDTIHRFIPTSLTNVVKKRRLIADYLIDQNEMTL